MVTPLSISVSNQHRGGGVSRAGKLILYFIRLYSSEAKQGSTDSSEPESRVLSPSEDEWEDLSQADSWSSMEVAVDAAAVASAAEEAVVASAAEEATAAELVLQL